jgi:DNA helicase HerA-like ATPase
VNGSIQARSGFVAPAEIGLRTGDTVIVRPESGGPGRLLALVESAVAKDGDTRNTIGTIQILSIISEDGQLRDVEEVPLFFGDVEPITFEVGRAYYGSVKRAKDPATGLEVAPAALNAGELLTNANARIPVVFNASGFNRHTALLAQSGAGKSYALGVIIEELLERTSARLVILDPNGDFARLRDLPAGKDIAIAESHRPELYRSAIAKLSRRNARGVLFNFNPLDSGFWDKVISEVVSRLWERRDDRRPTIIVVDEAHNFVPADDKGNSVAAEMMKIAAEGRKYGLWLFLASQRPQKLHPNVISQCDNLIVMKLSSHLDIDHIAGAYGAVDQRMIQLATGFKSGSALVAGRIVKAPTLMRFRLRKLPESGGDIELNWAVERRGSALGKLE